MRTHPPKNAFAVFLSIVLAIDASDDDRALSVHDLVTDLFEEFSKVLMRKVLARQVLQLLALRLDEQRIQSGEMLCVEWAHETSFPAK
jgi:hypothetical protein